MTAVVFSICLLLSLPVAANSAEISQTSIDFRSEVTGRNYRLRVFVPAGDAPAAGFPVVYLIDGNLYFGTAVDIIRLQGLHYIDRAIVVGVGYQTENVFELMQIRVKDLTLPIEAATLEGPVYSSLMPPDAAADDFGGLDAYLDMLVQEVRPRINALAAVDDSQQILFGHSLGGLATTRALLTRSESFSAYVISAPSLWWNDFAVLDDLDAFLLQPPETAKHVVLGVGGLEDQPPPLPDDYPLSREEVLNNLRSTRMVAALVELGERLSAQGADNLQVSTTVFADENHASVVPAVLSRGLSRILDRWDSPEP